MELLVPFVSIATSYTTTPLPAGHQSPEDEEELGAGAGGRGVVGGGGGGGLRGWGVEKDLALDSKVTEKYCLI